MNKVGTVLLGGMIVLHGAQGRILHVNPHEITNMTSGIPGKENEVALKTTRCWINMTDGKFIQVKETCEEIRAMIERVQ